VLDALRSVAGVADVVPGADLPEGVTFEVKTEAGRDVRPDVARVVVEGGFQLLGLRQVGMSLEDIFLHLTTTEPGEEPTPVPDGETLPSQSDETEVTQ
jgi:ABC-2 type transport system ATP-binding protein